VELRGEIGNEKGHKEEQRKINHVIVAKCEVRTYPIKDIPMNQENKEREHLRENLKTQKTHVSPFTQRQQGRVLLCEHLPSVGKKPLKSVVMAGIVSVARVVVEEKGHKDHRYTDNKFQWGDTRWSHICRERDVNWILLQQARMVNSKAPSNSA